MMTGLHPLVSVSEATSVTVCLPPNVTRIETQADLYTYGVKLLGFQEVADEVEAVERAEGRDAFLLKSTIKPVFYLIFPHAIVKPYERSQNA